MGDLRHPIDAMIRRFYCGVPSACLVCEEAGTPATEAMMLDLDGPLPSRVSPATTLCYLRRLHIIILNYCWGKCTSVQLGCVCFVIFAYVLLLNTLSDGYYLI